MEWISVKDRLPELQTEVLCVNKVVYFMHSKSKNHDRVLTGRLVKYDYDERTGFIDENVIGDLKFPLYKGGLFWAFPYISHQKFVTHWMPLPEPPTE